MDDETIMPPKVKTYGSTAELLAKLGEKEAMWEGVARDAKDRAAEFERAGREVRNGSASVTVGRTTYVLNVDERTDTAT